MSEPPYNNIIQGLQEVRQHFRGEITLRVITLTRDETGDAPADPETAWYSVNGDGDALVAELRREMMAEHPLANADSLVPVSRRFDRDDVIFRVDGLGGAYARVHLTYDPPRHPALPITEFFDTLQAATAPNG